MESRPTLLTEEYECWTTKKINSRPKFPDNEACRDGPRYTFQWVTLKIPKRKSAVIGR